MRRLFLVCVLCACAASGVTVRTVGGRIDTSGGACVLRSVVPTTTADYILVMGQSNADGRPADASGLASYALPLAGTMMVDLQASNLVWRTAHYRSTDRWSIELPIVEILATNGVAAVIKVAQGSSDLAVQWSAASGAVWSQYQRMVTDGTTTALRDRYVQLGTCRGCFWYQGESDATNKAWADSYSTNLTNFVAQLRSVHGADMPFICARINTYYGDTTNNPKVRNAQSNLPSVLANCAWVDTDDVNPSDAHASGSALVTIGKRMAAAWLALEVP